MTADAPFWDDRFHWCALAAGFLAASEGRLSDSSYCKHLTYEFYEQGAFRDRVPPRQVTGDQCVPAGAGEPDGPS